MNSDDEVNTPQRSSLNNIEEILKCPICLSRVVNAMLCPHCSKVMCSGCIKKWITEQRAECPMCKRELQVHQLINCRFVAEVSMELDKLKTKKGEDDEVCNFHGAPLYYYCNTCATSICSDCAMFEKNHSGHKFEHLKAVYQKHVDLVKAETNTVRKRLKDLTNQMKSVELNIELVSKAKEEKGSLVDEIEILDGAVNRVNKQLSTYSKNLFIQRSSDLIKLLQELHAKPSVQGKFVPISTEFESEIVPPYTSSVFCIKNYSKLRETNELIYSDNLVVHSLTWRLKVYPNGNGVARGTYISVFLEMVKGVKEVTKYEYKVEMMNYKSNNQTVVREFASDFEEGECWGYNRFFQIDLLEREGYLSADDSITLKFSVRAPTYMQECRDLKHYINQLEHQREQAILKQLELQQKYDSVSQQLAKELRRHTRWSSSDSNLLEHIPVAKPSSSHSQELLEVTKDLPKLDDKSSALENTPPIETHSKEEITNSNSSWTSEEKKEEEIISIDIPQHSVVASESSDSKYSIGLEWTEESAVDYPHNLPTPTDSGDATIGTPVISIRSSTNSVSNASSKHSSVDLGWEQLEFNAEEDFWRSLNNQLQNKVSVSTQSQDQNKEIR